MDISQSIEIMKSLADTSRLRVLNSLMDKPQYVEELAHRLNLAISTVSFHLKKLEKVKLVRKVKEQYYVIYQINDDVFKLTLKELTSFENIEKYLQEERINQYRDKILRTFFKKGKLIKLPVQHKKRTIIIEEFVKMFKPGKEYTEKEVNEIIRQSFDDYCVIRRIMVDEEMMERKNQIYRLKIINDTE